MNIRLAATLRVEKQQGIEEESMAKLVRATDKLRRVE